MKFIGHLDLLRLFQRAFKRAEIPVKFSKGFNPHPKFSIANPLSLGIESEEEYMDIELDKEIDPKEFINRMNQVLPGDIQILDAIYAYDNKSISSQLKWAHYLVSLDIKEDLGFDMVQEAFDKWLDRQEIFISRLRKKGKKKVMVEENIRPLFDKLAILDKIANEISLEVYMRIEEGSNLRPLDFAGALGYIEGLDIDLDSVSLVRKGLYLSEGENLYKPI